MFSKSSSLQARGETRGCGGQDSKMEFFYCRELGGELGKKYKIYTREDNFLKVILTIFWNFAQLVGGHGPSRYDPTGLVCYFRKYVGV